MAKPQHPTSAEVRISDREWAEHVHSALARHRVAQFGCGGCAAPVGVCAPLAP